MTKILGLDLGTNSIGWAVVDSDNKKIIDTGVRIFPEGVEKDTIGQGDKELSKNAERREHRQSRRQFYRKKIRKIKLLEILIEYGMCPLTLEGLRKWKNWDKKTKTEGQIFPTEPLFIEWLKLNPYKLRSLAITEQITKHEFGRILFHLIQRRGFLSSRKGAEDGAIFKGKDNMAGITDTEALLNGNTLGHTLYNIIPEHKQPFKKIVNEHGIAIRARGRYTLREMYINEFEKIWKKQANNLDLEKETVILRKKYKLTSSLNSSRNSIRIKNLINKYGENKVIINGNELSVNYEIQLKEIFGGKIWTEDDKLKFKSNDSVLFWQRPLRSQKSLLGKCSIEGKKFFDKKQGKYITVGPTPCPISHPDFELFRSYQFINNIKYGKDGTKLNNVYRDAVMDLINKNDTNFDFEKITKILKLTYDHFNYDNNQKVPGNLTHKRISSLFDEKIWEKQREEIWHCFYFYDDPDMLVSKLVSQYGLKPENIDKVKGVKLAEGYSSISIKAIRNILPFLKIGYEYSTAVILGGVKNAFGERWEYFEEYHNEIISNVLKIIKETKTGEYEAIALIKKMLSSAERKYGFSENDKSFNKLYHHSQDIIKKETKKVLSEVENLRNPIVQQGLHELRRLVNSLMDKYRNEFGDNFVFDKIHVELGRDLRNSKKRRQEMEFKIRDNERDNNDARERLAEYGLKPSRENITKYRLFKEIEDKRGSAICPYTGRSIGISDVLGSKNLYQIEHIIPFSVSLDDSFSNKTICESNFNREKGELTPFEFYQKNPNSNLWNAKTWEEVEQRAYSSLPYQKAKKFINRKKVDKSEFIQRQLNDTRYISKKATEILSEICEHVRVLPGALTSELRRLWGLNNVIQSVQPLHLEGYKFNESESLAHYVVLNEVGLPKEIIPIPREKPITQTDQILIPFSISDKGIFNSNKKMMHLKLEIQTSDIEEGKYWAKVNVAKPIELTRIFTDRPEINEARITFRGMVENGLFKNDSLNRNIKTNVENGTYWASFKVNKTEFIEPAKDQQPKVNNKQVLLFGTVSENVFTSYIYKCTSNMTDGKYWAVLEVDFENADYSRAIISPPHLNSNSLIINGSVLDDGLFIADVDPSYTIKSTEKSGKYFTILQIINVESYHPIENKEPVLNKGESFVEGNVWVNKLTGEIMFDPKKNRDDHRHHAVDAITVALTELGYLQKLSHYFGEYKDRERGIGDRPVFQVPWSDFDKDVKTAIDQILISYNQNKKVLSKISKTISKNGKNFQSVGNAARGRLHREFYFGRHKYPIPNTYDKNSGTWLFEKDKQGNHVYYFHIRKPLSSIKNNKHVEKIVDHGIRKLIENRLKIDFNININKLYNIPANFFFDENKQPALFLKNKKGDPIPIKKVRMKEYIGNAVQLKSNLNQWVNPYNNHHVVIYRDINGELKEQVVSFWEVVERAQKNLPIYQLPNDGVEILETLQENDMFLIGLSEKELEDFKSGLLSKTEISKHLYRVQKISSMYYTFRHHLASTILNGNQELSIRSFQAWEFLKPIKIEINSIGSIT